MQDFKNESSEHHFGNGFMTAYQLAIEFYKRYEDIVEKLELDVGGKDTGKYNTLAKYLAINLSREVGKACNIEGAFLSNKYLTDLKYKYDDNENNKQEVVSSVNNSENGLSMFRLKN